MSTISQLPHQVSPEEAARIIKARAASELCTVQHVRNLVEAGLPVPEAVKIKEMDYPTIMAALTNPVQDETGETQPETVRCGIREFLAFGLLIGSGVGLLWLVYALSKIS